MTPTKTASAPVPATALDSGHLPDHDKILIVDFGSQVTQLIARACARRGSIARSCRSRRRPKPSAAMRPKAVILSGGPASVLDKDAPLAPQEIYDAGVPVLGICYGEQAMAAQLGGKVEGGHHREFGRAEVEVVSEVTDLRRRLAQGREISGLDEPWRPRHRTAARLPRARRLAERAGRRDRRRCAPILCHAVPSRSRAHAARRRHPAQFRAQNCRLPRRLDHARLQGGGDRENPRAGRQGEGDLRPFRRRRLARSPRC